MDLPSPLAWLVDEAGASPGPERFLAELGRRLLADGLPISGGALTLSVPHPIIARRTWLWRAETGAVIEALAFAAAPQSEAGREWLAGLGPVWEERIWPLQDSPILGWAGVANGAGGSAFGRAEAGLLREVARFSAAPLAALAAREARTALLEAYLGRRSAARVQAGALARGTGETIRAALLCADLRDFTALSEVTEPHVMISALDAWFDRIAGAVHAFGGEVLKFIGDGVLAIFPVTATSSEGDAARGDREACEAALRAVAASRAGMAHLDQVRQAQGLAPLPFGAALHFGEILWGNIGAADRLDFTAIGSAVNLVSRLEGLCKPLGRSVLISGAVAANTATALMPLGEHTLRGIADPCAVFTLPEV
ncbi:adenylate/guanylate cyclase domain-containing protein [Rhizobium leguminosarum]|uniref:Adenylate/guanylate cyclase domain-containing protein n=1 Tax=Rhizobium leguminosarum TaxID=384 RepID=A0A4Q8Y054_RHILE|nr:adenylate/guanylate cyclase domain-containing protein [Rhizobium leguminosarum]TAV49490.1 adenylate/guanylate cyclase domain-containing protein [Rhizobium leguminosarum]TAV58853.1 adenylate/guanylate cyclase domain-containing protein [Rhizobium leguminosarum]TAV69901.1 adenylate/guanylate cyclase domain-containing protein [Rhizobium leguminosarum]TAX72702.1 adenylate/guanylate cyclase domain-containing protein [Rhizobium leguminosarum]TAY17740.1 adenylate/guanylate cyclase domain-containing